ncbi:MAG: 50S ribosomal protein L29 [candidate division WOR-3 bacterium]
MKASEIRNMTEEEIRRTLASLRDEYFKLRLRRSTEELPNPLRLRTIRRDIARVLTILREIELKKSKK